MAGGATQNLEVGLNPTRSPRDQTWKSTRSSRSRCVGRIDLLRPDVVDFHGVQAVWVSQVDLVASPRPCVAAVASTREASSCVGANGNVVTVNRADDALIDDRACLPVPSWLVWQAHEKHPTLLVQYLEHVESVPSGMHTA